jgi:hypothetical protein
MDGRERLTSPDLQLLGFAQPVHFLCIERSTAATDCSQCAIHSTPVL